jgi:hypothetical protein
VTDPASADKAIGILGSEVYDRNRAGLRALAFQARGQACAYTPDSNSNLRNVRDKINVRTGQYPIWGFFHFFAAADRSVITPEAAQNFVDLFPVQYPQDVLNVAIDTGLVPACAMRVRRKTELGNLEARPPPYPCECYFDARLNVHRSECHECGSNDDCVDPQRTSCNYGFCEP